MSDKKFKVGQKVFARHAERYRTDQREDAVPGVVKTVGRQYVHVLLDNGLHPTKFQIHKPHAEVNAYGYSPDYYLHETEQEVKDFWAAKKGLLAINPKVSKLLSYFGQLEGEELSAFAFEVSRINDILDDLREAVPYAGQ